MNNDHVEAPWDSHNLTNFVPNLATLVLLSMDTIRQL
jgi:hypothetical protein